MMKSPTTKAGNDIADNDADFRWGLRCTPYQNIRMGVNLPTMLVTQGANDSRVDPINAKKFVSAL